MKKVKIYITLLCLVLTALLGSACASQPDFIITHDGKAISVRATATASNSVLPTPSVSTAASSSPVATQAKPATQPQIIESKPLLTLPANALTLQTREVVAVAAATAPAVDYESAAETVPVAVPTEAVAAPPEVPAEPPTAAPTEAPTVAPTEAAVAAADIQHPGVVLYNTAPPMLDNFITWVQQCELPVLIDYSSDNCPACDLAAPVVKRIAREYDGKLIVVGVNISREGAPQVSPIQYTPSFVVYHKGFEKQSFIGFSGNENSLYDLVKVALNQ